MPGTQVKSMVSGVLYVLKYGLKKLDKTERFVTG